MSSSNFPPRINIWSSAAGLHLSDTKVSWTIPFWWSQSLAISTKISP